MRTTILAALAAALTFTGCSASIQAAHAPAEAGRRDAIWASALRELSARGFELELSDAQRGLLRTKTAVRPGRVKCGFVTCGYRDTVEVMVAPDAATTVRVVRELSTATVTATPGVVTVGQKWFAPSRMQKETISGIEAEQQDILRAITSPQTGAAGG